MLQEKTWLFACICWLSIGSAALPQGYSADDAAKQMTLDSDLRVDLIAAEPTIVQPVAIDFDDRGRLWAIQYLQYPNPADLKRVQVDRYSRTKYDRLPEPPPSGPEGNDRITILEDTNGDGKIDKSKDFVKGLNLASGFAFGHGGVFVLNVPYLLYYADHDRDDMPDGPPEVLLTGFGMEDAHSVANSLTFGPDGWLYGCQGSTVTANVRGIEFQQGVWRYHPISKRFELFCEGGGNSWGLDFDSDGNLLYSTNYGGFVLLHAVQGGYFVKSFAKHGELHNPFAFGYFDHTPHTSFQGGHVTVGGIVYQADGLPTRFRNKYVAGDLLGHNVLWHHLERNQSTFHTAHGGSLLTSNDSWFASSDVTTGPDGAVYVADWHDQRTAHPDPDAQWDRTNGRIYRIANADQAPQVSKFDLSQQSNGVLLESLQHTNQWWVRRSRHELVRRHARGELAGRQAILDTLRSQCKSSTNQALAMESLWTLYCLEGFDEQLAVELLGSKHPTVRAWTIRFLGDAGTLTESMAHRLDDLAEQDNSLHVRVQLACSATRWPAHQAMPIINANINRDIDFEDPRMPLLWWWAVERHCVAGRDEVMRRFLRPTLWKSKMGSQWLLPKLIRRYSAENSTDGDRCVIELINAAPNAQARASLWESVYLGLQFQPNNYPPNKHQPAKNQPDTPASEPNKVAEPADIQFDARAKEPASITPRTELKSFVESSWKADPNNFALQKLAMRLSVRDALANCIQSASDSSRPDEQRIHSLEWLASERNFRASDSISNERQQLVDQLLKLAHNDSSTRVPLRIAAIRLLGTLEQTEIAVPLVQALKSSNLALPTSQQVKPLTPVQSALLDAIMARQSSARQVIEAVDRSEIVAAQIPIDYVRRMASFSNPELQALVTKHWGKFDAATQEDKLAEVRRLNNDLRAGLGNSTSGKELFAKHCAACHTLFDQGKRVGPDLTSANRKDRDYLLVSLVDPSGSIRKEFASLLIQTVDGRVITGMPVSRDDSQIVLMNSQAETITLMQSEIEAVKESHVSIMPDGLYRSFSPQQLRDLFSYLQGDP